VPSRDMTWRADAACRNLDTDIFFPDSESDAAPALEVCASCPVRTQCLDWAIATRQHDGVWGGTTESERKRIRRRRAAASKAA
jgi:WhiB family transcriptional regulator, redox-sensing transcriptional regulator